MPNYHNNNVNPLSKRAAVEAASDVLLGEQQHSVVLTPSVAHYKTTVESPNGTRRPPQLQPQNVRKVQASSSPTYHHHQEHQQQQDNFPSTASSPSAIASGRHQQSQQQNSNNKSSSSGGAVNSYFYLNDPTRPYKTCYAFIVCIIPTCVALLLSLSITVPDWFRSETFAYKKDGDYLSRYFEIPDKSFAALSPLSPNITCIPLYEPSIVSLAKNEYLQYLADRSIGGATGSSSSSSGSSSSSSSDVTVDAGAGDATAAARAIIAVSPFGCRDLGDAVTGVSWMHLALTVVLFINTALSVSELASRGPYGGDRSTARISFIFALTGFACSLLIVVGWYAIKEVNFCDKVSMRQRGFDFGWPFYSYCGIVLAVLFDLIHSGKAISRISRGPPSMSIYYRTLVTCWSSLGIFAQGHLRHTVIPTLTLTGYAEACLEFPLTYPCTEMDLYMMILLGAVALTIFISVLWMFFVGARAVDHRGRTLNHSTITGVVMFLGSLGLMVAIFALSAIDGKVCDRFDIPSIWDAGFTLGVGSWLVAPVTFFSLTFTIMNLLYQCTCTERKELVNLATGLRQTAQNSNNYNNNQQQGQQQQQSSPGTIAASDLMAASVVSPSGVGATSDEAQLAALRRQDSMYNRTTNDTVLLAEVARARAAMKSNQQPQHQQTQRPTTNLQMLKGRMHDRSDRVDAQYTTSKNTKQQQQQQGGKNTTAINNNKKSGGPELVQGEDGAMYLVRRKSMYHWFWWDSLVDSRSASILQREVADASEKGFDVEEEEDEDDNNNDNNNNADEKNDSLEVDGVKPKGAADTREQTRSPKIEAMNVG